MSKAFRVLLTSVIVCASLCGCLNDAPLIPYEDEMQQTDESMTETTVSTTVTIPESLLSQLKESKTTTVHLTDSTETDTKPVSTSSSDGTETTAAPQEILPLLSRDVPNLSEISLGITGKVIAKDGLNMRSAPTEKSNIVKLLPDNSKVTILSAADCFQDGIVERNNWLLVSNGGQKGYVCASYIDISLTKHDLDFTPQQWYALGAVLYQQYFWDIFPLPMPRSINLEFSDEMVELEGEEDVLECGVYSVLKPKSLTLEKLENAFFQEFSKQNREDTLSKYYLEHDGKLLTLSGLGDAVWLDHLAVEEVTQITEDEVTFKVREYNNNSEIDSGIAYDEYTFSLVYEDGAWKCGQFFDTKQ